MKLIIDIPEEDYSLAKRQVAVGFTNPLKMSIANGTPLPKGHGRLIDADALKSECYSVVDPKGIYSELKIIEDYYIDDALTIIEADKE